MENVIDNFRIKIALDTQILAYLIDNTYPNLTHFLKALSENNFVEIVCSRFCTYEFIGVRKLEHYLREVHKISSSGTVNFSSLLKYKNDWNAPELNYDSIFGKVKESVEDDLTKINDDFKINFDNINLHDSLWNPHKDVVLSSKISKEDSLVLISSIFPQEHLKEDYLIFLTNDDKFYRAFCGDEKISELDNVFTKYGVTQPITHKIIDISTPTTNKKINLIKGSESNAEIEDFALQFIRENILFKYEKLFLGKVLPCPTTMQGKLLCFKLVSTLPFNNIYLSIISKKLDAIYNTEKLLNFHNKVIIENYPYSPIDGEEDSNKISVEIKNDNGEYLDEESYNALCESGNFVFINPDNFV